MKLSHLDYLDWETRLIYSDWLEECGEYGNAERQRKIGEALKTGDFRCFLKPEFLAVRFLLQRRKRRQRFNRDQFRCGEFAFCAGKDDLYFLTKGQEEERKKECLQRIACGRIKDLEHTLLHNFWFIEEPKEEEENQYWRLVYVLAADGKLLGPFDKFTDQLRIFEICLKRIKDQDFWDWINQNLADVSGQIIKGWRERL